MEATNCLFCNISADVGQLVELKTKVRLFDDETELSSLSSEVLSVPINDGYICQGCKTSIVTSYLFKIKAATAMSGICEPSDIMRKVNIFINSSEEEDLHVMSFNHCLAIVPKSEKVFMEYNGWREYEIASVSNDEEIGDEISEDELEFFGTPGFLDQLQIKEEAFTSQRDNIEHESQFSILHDIFGDQDAPSTSSGTRGPRQKIDDWMKEMLARSKKVTTVGGDTNVVFTCCICERVQCATYTGMKVHIGKYHSAEKEAYYANGNQVMQNFVSSSETDSKDLPNQELNSSMPKHQIDHIWLDKMVITSTENDDEWMCGVCRSFYSKKQRGVKIHIIRTHCELNNYKSKGQSRNSIIRDTPNTSAGLDDTRNSELERHDYDLNWINEKIEESQVKSMLGITWKCCICQKYEGQAAIGLRIHIAKSHCKSKALDARNSRGDLGSSDVESTLPTEKWKCPICTNFQTTTEKGMKIHMSRMHSDRPAEESEISTSITLESYSSEIRNIKHPWDSEWIKEIAEGSDVGNGIWVCTICRMHAKSLHGIKVHIAKAHCLPKKEQQQDVDSPQEDDGGEYIHDNQVAKKARKNVKKKKWVKKILEKSETTRKTENGTKKYWVCSICRTFHGDSETGIRIHVIKSHWKIQKGIVNRVNLNNDNVDRTPTKSCSSSGKKNYHQKTSDLTESEKSWLSDQMHRSRENYGSKNGWKCRLCHKLFNVYTSMRYHLTSKHMKQMVVGIGNCVNDGASTSNGIK